MTPIRSWLRGFKDKTALVTGASRGLGRACALGLAEAGVNVIAVSRTAGDLEALAAASPRITPWAEDVTSKAFYSRLETLNQLHILVNSAGMNRPLPLDQVDPGTLDQMISLNIRAVYRTSQSAARVMLRTGAGGSIIHVSSQMGHVGAANRSVYCMTKHAVEGLTKALAVELAPRAIRVNSIAPTFIETDLTRSMLEEPEFRREVLERIPLGRIGIPGDIVGAVLLLASSASALMTGASLKIDGGWTAV